MRDFQIPGLSRTSKASMRVSQQTISVAQTTVDRKRSPSRMMMKAWRVVWVMRPQHTGRTLICQIRVLSHGPLIHASGSSAYDIFCSLFPRWAACLVGGGNQQVLWPDCYCTRWATWTTFHHRSSYECGECKKALCIYPGFKTVSHADRVQGRIHECFPQSAASTGWIRSPRSISSSKTRPKALDISSLLRSSLYSSVAVHVSHNGCRRSKPKLSTANKLYICQQTDHLLLSTTIFCCCQQTSSVLSTNCSTAISLNPTQTNHRSKYDYNEAKNCVKGNYKPTTYFVLCFVYCVLCITVLCCANNQMQIFLTQFYFFS